MKTAYSRAYTPAMPTVQIRLSAIAISPEGSPLIALVDTGSDASIVPLSHLTKAGPAVRRRFVRSHWGERRQVLIYRVDVHLAIGTLPAIEVIGDELGNEILLGRNVLNKLILLLDGPAHTTEMLER